MTPPSGWTTVKLQVTTPLFNAGHEQTGSGIRVPSVRGAMRFWFRALAGTVAGPDLALLALLEEAVFGSAKLPSAIKMRIRVQPPACRDRQPNFIRQPGPRPGHRPAAVGRGGLRQGRDDGKWIAYLLGQGLADAVDRALLRDFVEPGKSVEIDFRFSGNEDAGALALAALWLMCAYGGLGARTRRGFGGLRITGSSSDLPGHWTEESLLSPGLDHYGKLLALWPSEVVSQSQQAMLTLARLSGADVRRPEGGEAWTSRPSYPVLSQHWTRAALWAGNTEPDWKRVLGFAGEQYRWFRAREDSPGVPYRPQIKTPEWLNVTGHGDDRFGLGALGLPIVFKKDGPTVHADHAERGRPAPLRRASPLWLRAVGEEQRWKLFSFAFQAAFLPDDAAVHIWRGTRQRKAMTVTDDDLAERTDGWIDAMRGRQNFIRSPELR